MMQAVGSIGMISAPAIGGLLYQLLGYQGPFLVMSAAFMLVLLISCFTGSIQQPPATGMLAVPLRVSIHCFSGEGAAEEEGGGKCGQELLTLMSRPKIGIAMMATMCCSLNIAFVESTIAPFLSQVCPCNQPLFILRLNQLGTPTAMIPGIFMIDPAIVAVSSIVFSRLAKDRESLLDVWLVMGFACSAGAFALNGPMVFLTYIIPSTIWLAIGSQVLLGLSLGVTETAAFIMGATELQTMDRGGEAGFSTALAALSLSAGSCG